MTTEEILLALLRNEICGTALPEKEALSYNPVALYRLAKHHDLMHLVADALSRNHLLPADEKVRAVFEREQMMAVYREIQLRTVTDRIRDAFQNADILFVPLKGTVIRPMYSEPWMRTSCDIDILIPERDLDRAEEVLIQHGFTTDGVWHYHDISFYYGGVHLELHHNILENTEQIDRLLADVWKYTVQKNGMEYAETPAFFLFHHIAHMSYHFAGGGCGMKPFIDLWILRKQGFYEEKQLLPLLRKCNLETFYRAVCNLTDVWLEGKKHDELTEKMATYILSGGAYGNAENHNAAGAARNRGRLRYLVKRAFPPYSFMRVLYPFLRKHKFLLPFCYIHRFFSKLFGKDRKRVRGQIWAAMRQDSSKIHSAEELLKALEIH